MNNWYLASHVCACELAQGVVFMDLRALTYSALDAQSIPVLRRTVANWRPISETEDCDKASLPTEPDLLDALVTSGFLVNSPPTLTYSAATCVPTSACSPNWARRAKHSDTRLMLFRITHTYLHTLALLKARKLAILLRTLSCHPASPRSPNLPDGDLLSLVSLFAKLRLWFYTAHDQCLLDSLVLTSVLRSYRLHSKMHIGVSLMPFSAHAWVQLGPCVLDDSVDHVRDYTPILVA
jgi:hypothetical protein